MPTGTAGASTSVETDRREEELKKMLESEKTRCVHVYVGLNDQHWWKVDQLCVGGGGGVG